MDVSTEPGAGTAHGEAALDRWRRELVPFMVASLAILGAVFFAATIWNYRSLQERLDPRSGAVTAVLERLGQDAVTRPSAELQLRVVLEQAALDHKYRQNAALIQSRVWTRFMGFLTGMVLALSGCAFILGQLREDVKVSGEGSGIKGALETSSPGIVLAVAGTLLIAISLIVKTSVETEDRAIFLPPTVPIVTVPPPERMEPAQNAKEPARTGAGPTSTVPVLPPSMLEELKGIARPRDSRTASDPATSGR